MKIPLILKPAFKDYLWGGTKLRDDFGKECSFDKIAESWELSCHKDGSSTIENSEDKGLTLPEYIKKYGPEVLGSKCSGFENFPVLIKLIDAKDNLSVQVHPDNEYALKTEGEYGKTEMWYIVDCEENASLLYGFRKNISPDEFRRRIEDNTLLEVTNSVKVKKGDVFFIKAGTLHAIGKGILIAEIQQNSNTTYRIYDYGRKDKYGNSRELHIDKACEVTNLNVSPEIIKPETKSFDGYNKTFLGSCDYFNSFVIDLQDTYSLNADETSFEHILILDGNMDVMSGSFTASLKKGDSMFFPASTGEFILKGKCKFIITNIE